MKESLNSIIRDENDDLWTNWRLAYLKEMLAKKTEEHDKVYDFWKEVVDAFNATETTIADETKLLSGYTALKDALNHYNTCQAAYKNDASSLNATHLQDCYNAALNAVNAFNIKYNLNKSQYGDALLNKSLLTDAYDGSPANSKQVDVAEATKVNKFVLVDVINDLSQQLYGTQMWEWTDYADLRARLVEFDDEKIYDLVIKANTYDTSYGTAIEFDEVMDDLGHAFGLRGKVLEVETEIAVCESYLKNGDLFAAKIEELDGIIASVDQAIKDFEEGSLADAKEAYETAKETLDKKQATWQEAYDLVDAKLHAIQPIIDKINSAVAIYLGHEGFTSNITDFKEFLAHLAKEAEVELHQAETEVMLAEKAIEEHEAGVYSSVEAKSRDLAEKEATLKDALTELNDATAALTKATALVDSINGVE